MRHRLLFVPLLLLLAGVWALQGRNGLHVLSGSTMGTTWSVHAPAPPADHLASRIQAELDRLDRGVFSTWTPDSELSRFNRAAPQTDIPASADLIEVILLAQEIHALSRGAFDMTVGPLVDLWGFGPEPPPAAPPARSAIETARARLDSEAVEADPARGILRKARPVRLDLSGIAKGYAVDRIARLLDEAGVADYLVEIGGELRSRGAKGGGDPWTVAIERPEAGERRAQRLLSLPSAPVAVAGSGDYRNFFEVGGRRYSHEIDPRTGWPVSHDLAAVTVISDSAARADALATAFMVLGPKEGPALARGGGEAENSARSPGGPGIAAYFIMRAGAGYDAIASPAFTRFLQQSGSPASRQ